MINKKKLQNDIMALKGMLCLSDHEALSLDRWVKRHLDLPPIYTLNQACDAACSALEEGSLAERDGIALLRIFKQEACIERNES